MQQNPHSTYREPRQALHACQSRNSTRPSMYAALHVPEIIRNICDFSDDNALTVLARTSRLVHETAIRVIWRTLPNLAPLAKCYPEDSWKIDGDQLNFIRPLVLKDWVSVLKYAPLVWRLGAVTVARKGPACVLGSGVWAAMCTSIPLRTVLFPNIRCISWQSTGLANEHLPTLLVVVGEHLVDVEVEGFPLETDVNGVLQTALHILSHRFPTLRFVKVACRPMVPLVDQGIASSFASLACSLSSLVRLRTWEIPICESAIYTLAQLKTLRFLELSLPADAQWTLRPQTLTHPFPNLMEIGMAGSAATYIGFSRALELSRVERLNLVIVDDSPPSLLPDVFASVRHQFSPTSLRDLAIFHPLELFDIIGPNSAAVVRGDHLRPLLDFRKLKLFNLELQFRYALDDALLCDMARAWPEIELLYLAYDEGFFHETLPSVRALPPFAVHCPRLRNLGVRFDARYWETLGRAAPNDRNVLEDIYGELTRRSSTSALETLYVGTSPISLPDDVAAFLARTFPELLDLSVGSFEESDVCGAMQEDWERVESLLQRFRRVREDERRRMDQEYI
ncbi:hypothetical protein C8Q79DRAFT_539898 [Trametes meyenii]|nr:hypothetical protein C8Q79DRAFT_539898 [Trametes meyenii]